MSNEAPVGAIVAYAGPISAIPGDWMVCDGRALNKNVESVLFSAIGTSWGGDGVNQFYLPDLRGQFLRGVDRAQDGGATKTPRDPDRDARQAFQPPGDPTNTGNSGNSVGSFQNSATAVPKSMFVLSEHAGHAHGDPTWNGQSGPYELATMYKGPGGYDYGPQSAPTSTAGRHTHRIEGGDSETRPVNAYVYWIIRVR